jgi:hypothetical protein
VVCDAAEGIGEPCLWVDAVEFGGLNQCVDDGCGFAAPFRSNEHVVFATNSDAAHGAFGCVVVELTVYVVRFFGSKVGLSYESVWLIWLVSLCGALAVMQAACFERLSFWSCPAYVLVSELIYAAFRSKAKGLFPSSDEWRRRGL